MSPLLKNLVIPAIISLALILIYVIVFTKIYKDQSEEKKLIPIKVVFWIIVVLEIWKIFYLIGKDGGYYPNRYPIVFCSLIMFLYPMFCFKKNRFSDIAMGFSIIPSIIVYIAFIAVQWQYNMNLMNAHSFLYHGSMLAVAIYLITSKLYKFEFKKFYNLYLLMAMYVVGAGALSLFIGADISLFGPKVGYLQFIHKLSGFGVGLILLLILLFIVFISVYGIIALCSKTKKKNKKAEQKENEEKEVVENV
ncbi:MAG: YwaF family protein [Clostridia bacterium]|nr:YwaF family protein [Clostridia bacterium]